MPDFEVAAHHKQICEALEAIERRDIDRLLIEAPPRHTKSELASRRFPAWYLGRNPSHQVISSTYNGTFAEEFGREVRNIVAGPAYGNVFDVRLRPDSQAAGRWHTTQGGVYQAAGVGTSLTGKGAHLGIIDDPFKDAEEAESENRRDKVWKWFRSVFYTRQMPQCAMMLIMTRWHEDDLAARILDKEGSRWHRITLPAILEEGEDERALWPEWYSLDTLRHTKEVLGNRIWNALYQQNPTPEDGEYFKRAWFRRYTQAPKELTVYMSGDFAQTPDGGDYTEFGVWGVDQFGNIYALDWWAGRLESLEWVKEWLKLVRRWHPSIFLGESDAISRSMQPVMRKEMRKAGVFCRIELISAAGDKTAKARSVQALLDNGVIHFPHTEWADRVINESLKFPNGKHNDMVDVMATMGRWIHRMWEADPPKPKPEEKRLTIPKPTIQSLEPNDGFARLMRQP